MNRITRPLPPHGDRSRRLEGPRHIHSHRLGHLERDALGQRPRSGLQRRQQTRSRIRHHPLPDAGQRQPDRDARQPLVRRFVPRRPGLLAAFGHRPRLLPLCPRQTPAGRRTADARSGRRLPQRHAPRRNRHDAGHRQRTADAPRRGGPHARRAHAPPPPQRSRNDVRSRRPEAVERRSPEPLHAHGRGPRRRRLGDRSRGLPASDSARSRSAADNC